MRLSGAAPNSSVIDSMNIHELAIEITKSEGKKKAVNIAQTKEIVKVIGTIFYKLNVCEFIKLAWDIRKHGKK